MSLSSKAPRSCACGNHAPRQMTTKQLNVWTEKIKTAFRWAHNPFPIQVHSKETNNIISPLLCSPLLSYPLPFVPFLFSFVLFSFLPLQPRDIQLFAFRETIHHNYLPSELTSCGHHSMCGHSLGVCIQYREWAKNKRLQSQIEHVHRATFECVVMGPSLVIRAQ